MGRYTYPFEQRMSFSGYHWWKLHFFIDNFLLELLSIGMCERWLQKQKKEDDIYMPLTKEELKRGGKGISHYHLAHRN